MLRINSIFFVFRLLYFNTMELSCSDFFTEQMIPHLNACSTALEMSGAALLQRQPLSMLGKNLIATGQEMASIASSLQTLPNHDNAASIGKEAAQRCQYASSQMILAGTNLCPSEVTSNTPTTGKSWLKGGI